MSAKCSSYMYGTPYIFHFVHPLVKTAKIMVQRVNFERNLKNIRPPTVLIACVDYILLKTKGRIRFPVSTHSLQKWNLQKSG